MNEYEYDDDDNALEVCVLDVNVMVNERSVC